MIQYPQDYFNEEVRCGFRITELMKRCWAAQMEVLYKIDEICEKYNLEYFAYAGTLLGAVRHKGFIPWDDDLDIALKRKDYLTLMTVLLQELPDYYDLFSIYNQPAWYNTFSRVVNTKKLPLEDERIKLFHNFPLPAGIDIFPLDYVPKNQELAGIQRDLLNLTWRMIKNLIRDSEGKYNAEQKAQVAAEINEAIEVLAEFCSIPSVENRSLIQVFQLIFEQLSMLGIDENSDGIASFSTFNQYGYKSVLKKQWYDESEYMGFEYGKIKVPCGYDKVLTANFNNYMKYVKYGQDHAYPYYQKAIRQLKEAGKWTIKEDPKDMGQQDEESIIGSVNDVPDKWKKIVERAREEKRRVVLFQPMLTSLLAREEKYIETVGSLLELFLNNSRVYIWFRPHINEHVPYCDIRPELFQKYQSICERYRNCDRLIYDVTENQLGANKLCDVYVGDECPLSDAFGELGKRSFFIDYIDNKLERFVSNF